VEIAYKLPATLTINKMPAQWHMVKVKAKYQTEDHKVIIETPVYENPWWLYGGKNPKE
jgi:hypothetical protein